MRADQARQGDVLLDQHGKVWLRSGDNIWSWATFDGSVGYYGDWRPEYGPQGELCLLVRDGQPITHRSYLKAGPPDVDAGTVAEAEQQ